MQRNGVPSSLDVERIVHACSETGFEAFRLPQYCYGMQRDGVLGQLILIMVKKNVAIPISS